VLPSVARTVPLDEARELLACYATLAPDVAGPLVRAARQYQAALWGAEGDPSLAWLQLVSALEAAASTFDHRGAPPSQRIREEWPTLGAILDRAPQDVRDEAAALLAPQIKVQRKLRALLHAHAPPEPAQRPTVGAIEWSNVIDLVMVVYRLRSAALHAGLPIPTPMCLPPHVHDDRVPSEGGLGGGYGAADPSWAREDVPMLLHTFAYIVGEVLRSWWQAVGTPAAKLSAT
jgi:hypothetical protein